jgi:CBS domain containing-hemolysin-like protein
MAESKDGKKDPIPKIIGIAT